jgi:hypothetical protein
MEDTLRIPIVCPECATELVVELPTAPLAEALATGGSIDLYANCHGKAWQASFLEREQLREYLEAVKLSRSPREPRACADFQAGGAMYRD